MSRPIVCHLSHVACFCGPALATSFEKRLAVCSCSLYAAHLVRIFPCCLPPSSPRLPVYCACKVFLVILEQNRLTSHLLLVVFVILFHLRNSLFSNLLCDCHSFVPCLSLSNFVSYPFFVDSSLHHASQPWSRGSICQWSLQGATSRDWRIA